MRFVRRGSVAALGRLWAPERMALIGAEWDPSTSWVGVERMMMGVRAWWWARVRSKPEEMPRDVREYIIRRHLKAAVEGADTLEEKRELSTSLMSSALSLDDDQIGRDLRDELIAASSKLLDGVPLSSCSSCRAAVFAHEAVTIDGATYCKRCAGSRSQ